MWNRLLGLWNRTTCYHEGGKREVTLGVALPGNPNPIYLICLDCGAVKVEERK